MNEEQCEICIVGGGIGGMTLTSLFKNEKVILVEKEPTLGGCHRVTRNRGYFTDHSPRVYSTNYLNTIALLSDIGIDWNDYFTKYDFQFLSIGFNEILSEMTAYDISMFVIEFIRFSFNQSPIISIGDWMNQRGISERTQNVVDRLCRMTDGSDKTRYLLTSFLSIFNQNFFYSFQQPTLPMDKGLMAAWENKLNNNPNLKILKNEEVLSILPGIVLTDKRTIKAKKIIFAMPPQYVVEILKRSQWNPFSNWKIRDFSVPTNDIFDFAEKTKYIKYTSVTFHFKNKQDVSTVWGLAKDSKWGIVFIRLSDYMKDIEPGTKDVFTIAVTKHDTPGLNGKRADECYDSEIKEEVWREMNEIFHFPEKPEKILIYHGDDTAFVKTVEGFGEWQGTDDVYMVSTHVGNSHYVFTSMESAVSNAIWLYNKLTGANKPIYKLWTVDIFVVLLILLTLALVILFCSRACHGYIPTGFTK